MGHAAQRAVRLLLPFLLAFFSAAHHFPIAAAGNPDASSGRAESGRIEIRVLEGDWGRAHPSDIEAVLRSAAAELSVHVADRKPLAIVVVPASTHPQVLYEKTPAGEYVVQLSARDRRWAQYAYQFAHEFCHVLANFDQRVSAAGVPLTRHQWFEETLCDVASIFTLQRMAETWQSAPPFPHWKSYAPWLRDYADQLLAAKCRQGASALGLAAWYAANGEALAGDPYMRERNEFCATALLSRFKSDPAQWNALRYLNLGRSAAADTFRDYLVDWQRSSPEKHHRFVGELATTFGFAEAIALR